MANNDKEKYLLFNSSTHRQDDSYMVLDKRNKPESNIQAQVHNRKEMEPEHIMAKELILNDEEHEKLEYNKCLKSLRSRTIASTLVTGFIAFTKFISDPEKVGSNLLK